jgi:Tfp pilus assembly protein PilX
VTSRARSQRGATLVVALIMLAIITLVVIGGFTLSNSNLKAVGNMQMREEAVAAGNRAVEVVLGSGFASPPTTQDINVDINNDGTNDFVVTVAAPTCVKAVIASTAPPSGIGLSMGSGGGTTWYTDWDIQATVNDAATGASVEVHQGVRLLLTDTEKVVVCGT